jgi:hypothetical protein
VAHAALPHTRSHPVAGAHVSAAEPTAMPHLRSTKNRKGRYQQENQRELRNRFHNFTSNEI